MTKHFSHFNQAEYYHKYRPIYHDIVIDKIQTFYQITNKIENALDMACGTGHSTVPLLKIASNDEYKSGLTNELAEFFNNIDQTLLFKGIIWYLRKN
jgi:hypothetical protein